MKNLLKEIQIAFENYNDDELFNFEIRDNKLLFENEDNNFEVYIENNEVIVNYICKNDDNINKFNYEIDNNKINDCDIDEWIVCLFGDLYDICMYDDDDF
jgi:uncharacterized protein (UPF0333 family)